MTGLPTQTGTINEIPVTPSHRLVSVRMYSNETERKAAEPMVTIGWPHIRPKSVLITAMGNHWRGSSWQKVVDMMMQTNSQGFYCGFTEIQDRCFNVLDAMGTMRNESFMLAVQEGWNWLLQIDNDIQPEPNALINLLRWDMPVVYPYIVEPGTGKRLHGPPLEPNTGLRRVKWAVLSMVLYDVGVIRSLGTRFWADAMGADEGFHSQTMDYYGIRRFLDTSTVVQTSGVPAYPLASNRWPKEQRDKWWDDKRIRLTEPPDRRPINPADERCVEGEYLPFVIPPKREPLVLVRTGTKPVELPRTGTRPPNGT